MRVHYEARAGDTFSICPDRGVATTPDDVYPHWHDYLEILFVMRGSGSFYLQNAAHEVRAGDAVVVNSNDVHFTFSADPDCRVSYLLIAADFCGASGFPLDRLRFEPVFRDERLSALFQTLADENAARRPFYEGAVREYLLALLVHLARNHLQRAPDPRRDTRRKKLVQTAIQYIAERLSEPLSIDSIADAMGFSKFYFCRVFKEETGETIMEHLNRARCNHARLLLSTGAYTVAECAELCGFSSPAYFSTQYKKYTGESPSTHKKK